MVNLFNKEGYVIDVVLAADTAPGSVLVVGDIAGVCIEGGVMGQTVGVLLRGAVSLPKAITVGTGVAQGKKVYWDAVNSVVTGTSGINVFLGYQWKGSADADNIAIVKLIG